MFVKISKNRIQDWPSKNTVCSNAKGSTIIFRRLPHGDDMIWYAGLCNLLIHQFLVRWNFGQGSHPENLGWNMMSEWRFSWGIRVGFAGSNSSGNQTCLEPENRWNLFIVLRYVEISSGVKSLGFTLAACQFAIKLQIFLIQLGTAPWANQAGYNVGSWLVCGPPPPLTISGLSLK